MIPRIYPSRVLPSREALFVDHQTMPANDWKDLHKKSPQQNCNSFHNIQFMPLTPVTMSPSLFAISLSQLLYHAFTVEIRQRQDTRMTSDNDPAHAV